MTALETDLARKRRARRMARLLAEAHPDAHCELDHGNALELAVATILSAQSTDKGVNQVTPKLFARYPTAADYASAERVELEEIVRPTGFYRNKADALMKLGQALVERFGGEVPDRMEDLVSLPGIGRKTANVILGNAFGIPGLTVDTHFQRLVHRWEWTDETDPVKIETAVAQLIERRDWTMASHRIIFHGRRVCHARKPACGACTLARLCPAYGTGPTDPVVAARLLKGPRATELAALAGVPDDSAATAQPAPGGARRSATPAEPAPGGARRSATPAEPAPGGARRSAAKTAATLERAALESAAAVSP